MTGPARLPYNDVNSAERGASPGRTLPGMTAAETAPTPLLQNPRFLRFTVSRLASQTGQNALLYGLLIVVVDRTGSSLHTSLFVLASVVPSVLVGLVAGVVVDRLPKKLVLVAGNAARVGVAVGLAYYGLDVWHIYLFTLLLWTVHQFYSPAEGAATPALVPREQLSAANAMLNFALTVAQILGMAILAPLTLKTVGPEALVVTTAALFGAGIFFLMPVTDLSPAGPRVREERTSLRAALTRGWRILREDPHAYQAMVQYTLISAAMAALVVIIPKYVESVLSTSAENTVFVFAPGAVGVVLGLRLAAFLARLMNNRRVTTLGFALFVACLAGFGLVQVVVRLLEDQAGLPLTEVESAVGLSPVVAAAMILSAPAGFAFALVGVASRTVLLEQAPPHMRGRVFATQNAISSLITVPPTLAAGLVADLFDARLVAVGMASLLVAAYLYTRSGVARLPAPAEGAAAGTGGTP